MTEIIIYRLRGKWVLLGGYAIAGHCPPDVGQLTSVPRHRYESLVSDTFRLPFSTINNHDAKPPTRSRSFVRSCLLLVSFRLAGCKSARSTFKFRTPVARNTLPCHFSRDTSSHGPSPKITEIKRQIERSMRKRESDGSRDASRAELFQFLTVS